MSRATMAAPLLVLVTALAGTPAFAQLDLSGAWNLNIKRTNRSVFRVRTWSTISGFRSTMRLASGP